MGLKTWTEERFSAAKQLWNDGWSASEIANKLGLKSRNQVIGFAHRHKEDFPMRAPRKSVNTNNISAERKKRGSGNFHTKASDIHARQSIHKPMELVKPHLAKSDSEIPQTQRVGLLGLTNWTCRWPLGDDPSTQEFCGAIPLENSVYCECHHERAHTRVPRVTGRPFKF